VVIPVENRTENNLHPLILKHVKVGSILYSDSFSSYINNVVFPKVSKLETYGYIHYCINHKQEFCSSAFSHIHTNNIENLWKILKESIYRMRMTSNYNFAVARFYFHQTLTQEEQLRYIVEKLYENS